MLKTKQNFTKKDLVSVFVSVIQIVEPIKIGSTKLEFDGLGETQKQWFLVVKFLLGSKIQVRASKNKKQTKKKIIVISILNIFDQSWKIFLSSLFVWSLSICNLTSD